MFLRPVRLEGVDAGEIEMKLRMRFICYIMSETVILGLNGPCQTRRMHTTRLEIGSTIVDIGVPGERCVTIQATDTVSVLSS